MRLIFLFCALAFMTAIYSNEPIDLKEKINKWELKKNSPFLSYSAGFMYTKAEENNGRVIRAGLFCPR